MFKKCQVGELPDKRDKGLKKKKSKKTKLRFHNPFKRYVGKMEH